MKRIANILSILALLLTFSYNVSATVQAQDVIIIDKVEHKLNTNQLLDNSLPRLCAELY